MKATTPRPGTAIPAESSTANPNPSSPPSASPPSSKSREGAGVGPGPGVEGPGAARRWDGFRETMEQVALIVTSVILFKGFVADPFVIPTGSMAPSLMGRHKETTCPQCGERFAVNASERSDSPFSARADDRRANDIVGAICVNCRFPVDLESEPNYSGDRILVNKVPLRMPFWSEACAPDRWDVLVFLYPERPNMHYIKRLVGLPGESIRIGGGDVYVAKAEAEADAAGDGDSEAEGAGGGSGAGGPHRLATKPLDKIRAIRIPVHDDRHRPEALKNRPEWARWAPTRAETWRSGSGPASYRLEAADARPGPLGGEWLELRYGHRVPDQRQWEEILSGRRTSRPPRATLITDFVSYNTGRARRPSLYDPEGWMQPHWVGDLCVTGRLEVLQPRGAFRVELVRAGRAFRCELDFERGSATLWEGDRRLTPPAPSGVTSAGSHEFEFINFDGRLIFCLDGKSLFGEGLTYRTEFEPGAAPTEADLSPVAVAGQGTSVEVSDLRITRDLYHTRRAGSEEYRSLLAGVRDESAMFDFLSDPDRFAAIGRGELSEPYVIGPDHYMMLGDNSTRSSDSREWRREDQYDEITRTGWTTIPRRAHEVPANYLIGKAFLVYWPHAVPMWPRIPARIGGNDVLLPFRPNFERMGFIR